MIVKTPPKHGYECVGYGCEKHGTLVPKPYGTKRGQEPVCEKCREPMKKVALTSDQKSIIEEYERALREEDRYLGSVFANSVGERRLDAKRKEIYETAIRRGVRAWC